MLYLYYKMNIVNEEYRKIEFPTGFFDRLNRSVWYLLLKETKSRDCGQVGK